MGIQVDSALSPAIQPTLAMSHLRTPSVSTFNALALLLNAVVVTGCADAAPERATRPDSSSKTDQTPVDRFSLDADEQFKDWKFLVLHHSGTDAGSLESIDAVHRRRRDSAGNLWRGIGYHFLIGNGQGMSDGQIQATFRWTSQLSGAHAGSKLYNQYGVGICLVGNFETSGPTSAQLKAVRSLIAELKSQFGLTTEQVLRHGDLKATACPGRHFPFEEIASTPAAGPQLANDHRRTRSTMSEASHTEGMNSVVSVLRSKQRRAFSMDERSGEQHAK